VQELIQYVEAFTERGACTCGRCIDAPDKPECEQPSGHTINLTFFEVAAKEGAKREELEALLREHYPKVLDGKEHSYLEIGADLGDQGRALMLIGLGGVLGIWNVLSPDTMMPDLTDDLKKAMAGKGLVCLQATGKVPA
jgi:hypothetical protein